MDVSGAQEDWSGEDSMFSVSTESTKGAVSLSCLHGKKTTLLCIVFGMFDFFYLREGSYSFPQMYGETGLVFIVYCINNFG